MSLFSSREPHPFDREQVQALYRDYGPAMILYACALLRRRHEAEDIVQEVFMKLLEYKTLPEEPKPYLFRAVHNAALNRMRIENRNTELDDLEPWFEAPNHDLSEQLSLQAGLRQLPLEQRQVLILHVWAGLTFAKIAAVLGVSSNTAASRYRYAIQKLRAVMQPERSSCH